MRLIDQIAAVFVEFVGGHGKSQHIALKRLGKVLDRCVGDDDANPFDIGFAVGQVLEKTLAGLGNQRQHQGVIDLSGTVEVAALNLDVGEKRQFGGEIDQDSGHESSEAESDVGTMGGAAVYTSQPLGTLTQ